MGQVKPHKWEVQKGLLYVLLYKREGSVNEYGCMCAEHLHECTFL